jgi:alkanesulfonate monooxygenase SsuD/methylene tetrahydromethanopterin reductase-like flavin-dependent oxidoreductase (luciferase family)
VQFALSVPPFRSPADLLALAIEAEDNGWDGVFLWDHLRWDDKVDVHDPWTLLGAFSVMTSRIQIGTMVTPLSRRRPWVVAKHLVTLDHLSGGRVVLGIGLGDPPDLDFSDFGDEPSYRKRAAITDESLAVLDGLLDGSVAHRGDHLAVTAAMRPLPVQRPRPPIWIAGRASNLRPLQRAQRWDGYVPISSGEFLTPDELAAYVGPHPRDEWDLVAQWKPGVPSAEFADAGATWLVRSCNPHEPEWFDELREIASSAPE